MISYLLGWHSQRVQFPTVILIVREMNDFGRTTEMLRQDNLQKQERTEAGWHCGNWNIADDKTKYKVSIYTYSREWESL